MSITNQEKWDSYVTKNTDSYGKACVDTARRAMEILDKGEDFDTHGLICEADKEGELTGFMAGAVASMIKQCHSRGEEFNKKWNADNGGTGEEKGTINPAIMTVGK